MAWRCGVDLCKCNARRATTHRACSDCPPARHGRHPTPAQHMAAPRGSKRPRPQTRTTTHARTPSPSPSAQLPRGHGKSWRPGKHATAGSGTPVSLRAARWRARAASRSGAAFLLFAAEWTPGRSIAQCGSRDGTACAYGASTWFCSPRRARIQGDVHVPGARGVVGRGGSAVPRPAGRLDSFGCWTVRQLAFFILDRKMGYRVAACVAILTRS